MGTDYIYLFASPFDSSKRHAPTNIMMHGLAPYKVHLLNLKYQTMHCYSACNMSEYLYMPVSRITLSVFYKDLTLFAKVCDDIKVMLTTMTAA